MTDLELTKICAEAMGYTQITGSPIRDEDGKSYRPLHDDAQAMALVKKFNLSCIGPVEEYPDWIAGPNGMESNNCDANHSNLNRAICECVAKMQLSRNSNREVK